MVILAVAEAVLEKFGGDSISETRRNLDSFVAAIPAGIAPHRNS
jgi:chorismate synthase